MTGGATPGPIWPCLASFTPSGEAGNGATVASFGTPLTRTRWASWPWLWPWLASLRVARSGETFNSVAFGCISLLSCRLRGPGFHPHPSLLPSREKGSDRLHGNDGGLGLRQGPRVGGATAGTESLGRDRLRWCTLATPGIGPGRSRPRHACRNLGGVCKWVTHARGRNRGLCCSIGIIVLVLWHN